MATTGVLKYRKYQDKRKNAPTSGKWYGKAVQDRTVEFDDFMAQSLLAIPTVPGISSGITLCMAGV